MNNIEIPVLIIGSGVASLTASIYISRAKIDHILISGNNKGGQLITSPEIENFPGIPLISGIELMKNIEQHAKDLGGKIVYESIRTVNFTSSPFTLIGSINTYIASSVIVATGSLPITLGLENEIELIGKGISYCAICDGHFYKNQEVAVVGGGNTAIEEALYLSNIVKKVTLIHRRDTLRGDKILQERLFKNPQIEVLWNYNVTKLKYDNSGLYAITLTNNINKTSLDLLVNALFISIGYKPATEFLQNHLELDAKGHIITKGKTSKTSIEGVFAAGDVQEPHYKQAIISAGSGAIAALDTIKYLIN